MAGADQRELEERLLVLAPTARDAEMSRTVLAEVGVACHLCPDLAALCRELEAGAGAVVLTEEALAAEDGVSLADTLARQPPWSDLPLLVLTAGGADSPAALHALDTLGNVTLLERPVRVTTLVSAVRAALRARRRQYQLREHIAELRQADHRKNEFLAMLAHELRNPLAPIRNALHILRRQRPADTVVGEMGAMMERQVRHMVRLVDDLLDVSRITRGKIELKKEPVDLAAVVRRAVEDVRPFLDERQHQLEVTLPDGPLELVADPTRLEQVLANLLHNAGKYSEPGSLVRLTAAREGAEAVLRVRDNGIGIRPEMTARIFEMFAQGDRVSGRLQEGLGLGLTLVRSLVELHGGTVAAFSEGPGRGSEFVVRLPLAVPTAAEPAPRAAPESSAANGVRLRVLVVDDNADGAETLALLLRLTGDEVCVARDGPEALRAAAEFRPDVVLLDIGLPMGMDGYEVARRLRALPGLGEALLIALTGYGQEDDRERSRAAGFAAHLVKPADPDTLRELLNRRRWPV